MIHPLVRKELREHLWILVALWVLCAIALAGFHQMFRDAGSPLEAWRRLVIVFGILLTLALVNRLVVREYGGRTQLFLETLPVGRGEVIAIKWLTGAACLLLPMMGGLAVTLLGARDEVVLTPGFVLLLAARGASFLIFCYSLAFLIGLTGRYRYAAWAGVFFLAMVANTYAQLPLEHWAPLQMISAVMPFQRDGIPAQWFWITWTASAAFTAGAFLVALGSRGSWVVAMSRRMSLREKAIVTGVFLCSIYVVAQIDDRRAKPPFELLDSVASDGGLPVVSVARTDELSDDDAMRLARQVARDVQTIRDYLTLEKLPSVAVMPDQSLDADLYLVAELPAADGVVVKGAPGAEGFDPYDFRAFTISRLMDWHSHGRAMRERRRWLLEGLAQQLVLRDDPARQDLLALRAAVAGKFVEESRKPLDRALQDWLATREMLGDCLGDALAWRTVNLLATQLGERRFRDLARAFLGGRTQPDARAYLAEVPLDEWLAEEKAPPVSALITALEAQLRADAARFDEKLEAVRPWRATVTATPMRGTAYEVRYEVAASGSGAPPSVFAVRYSTIGPWQSEVPRSELARVDAHSASGVLPASFARGTRLLTAVEVPVPALACTIRLDARRWEVQ